MFDGLVEAGNFNPLPPCGGRRQIALPSAQSTDFNPLPPCGGRQNAACAVSPPAAFQSTPSVWRETGTLCAYPSAAQEFQSTPSVWRETSLRQRGIQEQAISIHSLRVEGDPYVCRWCVQGLNISIHSLRVEGDLGVCRDPDGDQKISIHSLRVEGDRKLHCVHLGRRISIHSLRVEGDGRARRSALPRTISIHSLRVEGDLVDFVIRVANAENFNPLPPCGGRHLSFGDAPGTFQFQSTPSVWRETMRSDPGSYRQDISIHSLRVEGDGQILHDHIDNG